MPRPVTEVLEEGLELVRRERPDAYAGIARHLDGLRLCALFDAPLWLQGRDGTLARIAPDEEAEIRVTGTREILLDLCHGRATLDRALRMGTLEVSGNIDDLGRGLRAGELFAGALLRIRSAERLLGELEG